MIYILSNDAQECAKLLDDKSLDAMISDIAQVLCNVHSLSTLGRSTMDMKIEERKRMFECPLAPKFKTEFDGDKYKVIFSDWDKWCMQCLANYNVLLAYARACCTEYRLRFINETDPTKRMFPKHKHHDVIAWCGENKPMLPREYEKSGHGYTELAAAMPLVMPEKYIVYSVGYGVAGDMKKNIIESYRAYYKAKLKKMARKECPVCYGSVEVGVWCEYCDNKGYITQAPTFTRREIPEWLGDL